jgi:hypothetical protein
VKILARLRVAFGLMATLAVVAGLTMYASPAAAAAVASGSQCHNGDSSPLTPTPCLNGALGGNNFNGYSTGNANANQAHWAEGDFIAYRTVVNSVEAGTHVLQLSYDTVRSSRHAIDYLGSYDATETTSTTATPIHANNNNPCVDVLGSGANSGCTAAGTPPTPASTVAVPAAALSSQRTCDAASGLPTVPTQAAGHFSLFAPTAAGAALTSAAYVSQNVEQGNGTCTTTIDVTFTVANATPELVIAWGGRIASALDWGQGNSAGDINGSPYHMTIVSLDGNPSATGTLQLMAAAVAAAPTIVTRVSASTVTAGNTLTDTATLTGSHGTVTGTVQFQLCSNTTTGCPQATGTNIGGPVALVNGSATSAAFGAGLAPGNYCIGLVYVNNGNSFYSSAYHDDVPGECFRVVTAAPTVSTHLSDNAIQVGGTVHDSATLTGATPNAGGTVQYRYYPTSAACQADTAAFPATQPTGGTAAGVRTVTNGSVPDSDTVTLMSTGSFFWGVFYSGDANNGAAVSNCAAEVVVVSEATPPISTSLSANPIPLGGTVHDSATLTGATDDASGTVDYRYYSTLTGCQTDTAAFPTPPTGGTEVGQVMVTDGDVPNSPAVTFSHAGTFYWAAFYSGDEGNEPAVSDCLTEALVVRPLTPTIASQLSASTIAAGGTAQDSATLTGATATAGGPVQYRYYTTLAACRAETEAFPGTAPSGGTQAGTGTVTNGSVPNSNTVTFPDAGTFFWAAFYSGDTDNTGAASDCASEVLVVQPLTPTIATTLSANPIPLGGSVHDSATLTGATPTAGGTVQYRYYPTLAECQTDTGAFPTPPTGGTQAGTGTVTNGAVPDSNTVTFPTAGTFYWAVFYTGDASNRPSVSECVTEALVVSREVPPISTTLSANPIPLGGSVHDSATLTGATPTAGGTVQYRYYPTLAECQTDTGAFPTPPTGGTQAGTGTVVDGAVPDSNTVTFPNAGTFYWAVFYTGDDSNSPAASDCRTEALVVQPFTPTIATQLSASTIPAGGSVHDTAKLTGATPSAGGTVAYRFYSSLTACQTDAAAFPGTAPKGGTAAGTVTVTNGVVPNSNTVTFAQAGTFFWTAFYSGDTNNRAANSGCVNERLVVTAVTPPPLPVTGTPTAKLATVAGSLITAGFALLLAVARRRRRFEL